jgi:hypothetical protein
MRRLSIAIALLLSCTAAPPVTVPSPSATASPIPLPSAATSLSPRPDLTIVPAGEIRGDHALVLQVSAQPGGATSAMRFWDVPLDGTPPKQLVSYNRGEQLLTQGDTFDFSRQLSPDGRQLVLADPVDMAGTGLLVVDLIAGTTRLIRTTGGADRPAWSPDGRRIAYRGFTVAGPLQKETGIWVVSAAGGTPQQVVAGALSGGDATWVYGWTEDGAGLAIGTGGAGAAGVSDMSVVDVATGTLTRIGGAAQGMAIRVKRPSVAIVFEDQPSGAPPTGIAGAPGSAARAGHLEVRDTTFAAPRTVARYGVEGTMLWDPRWNPSSNEILMFWLCGEGVVERDELVVVDGVTGARRALATSSCVRSASWNADGTKILYTGDLETARLRNADGSKDHELFRPAMPPGAFQHAVIAVTAFAPH